MNGTSKSMARGSQRAGNETGGGSAQAGLPPVLQREHAKAQQNLVPILFPCFRCRNDISCSSNHK